VNGGRMGVQPRTLRNDGRSATIILTLPVKFRGGALIVTDPEGREETFPTQKGSNIEWTAFLADCEYEVETVTKGCRMMMSYGVYIKGFEGGGEGGIGLLDGVVIHPEPLIKPSKAFMDLLGSILNMTRGRKIAFYVSGSYSVNPSEMVASSLIPLLKGGDALLYQALKTFKLSPKFNWTAGGYVWPADRKVEILGQDYDNLHKRVEKNGAMPLDATDILILTAPTHDQMQVPVAAYGGASGWAEVPQAEVGKERVPFVSNGELEKLVVNCLIVTRVH